MKRKEGNKGETEGRCKEETQIERKVEMKRDVRKTG